MGVLASINGCLNSIPKDIIDESTIYIEVDKETYDLMQQELTYTLAAESIKVEDLKFIEQMVQDFGKCLVFMYMGIR